MLLTVAFEGTSYSGWAPQANARTVAGELSGAIETIDPHASRLRAVSRTDAGVHALAQLAAFDTTRNIDPRGWVLALARELPRQIAVVHATPVPQGYDPRDRVAFKRYRYRLRRSQVADPFWAGRAWRVGFQLDLDRMAVEASDLVGIHDFAAFRSSADTRSETVRHILRAEVRSARRDDELLDVVVEGDRFLHNMVRIIAGTLVDVGRGRLPRGTVRRALALGDRSVLGMTAPPDGLYLEHVELEPPPTVGWPIPRTHSGDVSGSGNPEP